MNTYTVLNNVSSSLIHLSPSINQNVIDLETESKDVSLEELTTEVFIPRYKINFCNMSQDP